MIIYEHIYLIKLYSKEKEEEITFQSRNHKNDNHIKYKEIIEEEFGQENIEYISFEQTKPL